MVRRGVRRRGHIGHRSPTSQVRREPHVGLLERIPDTLIELRLIHLIRDLLQPSGSASRSRHDQKLSQVSVAPDEGKLRAMRGVQTVSDRRPQITKAHASKRLRELIDYVRRNHGKRRGARVVWNTMEKRTGRHGKEERERCTRESTKTQARTRIARNEGTHKERIDGRHGEARKANAKVSKTDLRKNTWDYRRKNIPANCTVMNPEMPTHELTASCKRRRRSDLGTGQKPKTAPAGKEGHVPNDFSEFAICCNSLFRMLFSFPVVLFSVAVYFTVYIFPSKRTLCANCARPIRIMSNGELCC